MKEMYYGTVTVRYLDEAGTGAICTVGIDKPVLWNEIPRVITEVIHVNRWSTITTDLVTVLV